MRGALAGALIGCFVLIPVAHANILTSEAADDGDGAIVCTAAWNAGTSELAVDGVQHWYPGHVLGTVTTDTELDPLMWVRNTVTNDSEIDPLSWTDYHITITMNKTFDIIGAATLPNWGTSYTPHATYNAGLGKWVGTVDYVMGLGGLPVNLGQDGQFDFQMQWAGPMQWCEEMVPTPEPVSMLLLGLGMLLMRRTRA